MHLLVTFVLCASAVGHISAQTTILNTSSKSLPSIKTYLSSSEWTALQEKLKPKGDGTANGKISPEAGRPNVAINVVTNGTSSKRGQFVWQAFIVADEASFCGGALVKSDVVLTAAQCVAKFSKFRVTLGAHQRGVFEGGRLTVETEGKVVHAGFDPVTLNNDLALLRLTYNVTSRINPLVKTVRLPRFADQTNAFLGKQGVASGWGTINKGGQVSDVSSHGALTVLPGANCSVYFSGQFGENSGRVVSSSLCCLSAPTSQPCNGDVGGPFVFKEADGFWTLLGVGSFASPAGCSEGPRVFSRVTSFLSWIATNANIKVRA